MSLRILFADDSVTAQNMGKKILTEAGYEVIAVSNGAAAVKKIAELKPDIIILDVYMPGYSGLEVCEKVRSNIATIKTPVLLTVGKMEPYKPEDANRVRADGVIIKPFEASDLLAIIKKFEERIKAMPAPAIMAPPPARKVDLYPEPETPEPPPRAKVMQPTVEVPDHMASSSAFSDLLSSEAGYPTSQFTAPAQADETAKLSALPDYELPMSWRQDSAPEPIVMVPPSQLAAPVAEAPVAEAPAPVALSEPEPTPEAISEHHPPEHSQSEHHQEDLSVTEVAMDAPPSFSDPAPVAEIPDAPVHVAARPIQIPVYQDTAPAEFMPTAAAPTGDIEVPREPALQESAEEITRSTVADTREAGLMPTSHAEADESSTAEEAQKSEPVANSQPFAEISVGAPESVREAEPAPPIMDSQAAEQLVETAPTETAQTHKPALAESLAPAPTLTNDDFEARVAAAMAAYGQAQPASPVPAEASIGKNGLSDLSATAVPPAPFIAHEATHAVPATQPIASVPQPVVSHMQPAPVQHVASPVAVEPEPPLAEMQPPEPEMEEAKAAEPAPEVAAPLHAESANVSHATAEAVTAKVEAELPAVANAVAEAAEASGAEHRNIAQVVHRVMERMKGDLVDEIVRELRGKK